MANEMRSAPSRSSRAFFGKAVVIGFLVIGAGAFLYSRLESSPATADPALVTPTEPSDESEAAVAPAAADIEALKPLSTPFPEVKASPPPGKAKDPEVDALTQEWRTTTARLKELEECMTSQSCPFPQDTPSSYSYAVNEALAAELRHFAVVAGQWQETGGQIPEEAQQVARHFLASPSDEVKEAAIEFAAAAPPSPENMRAVIGGLRDSVSGPLYKTGLEELVRYANTEQSSEVNTFLLETIKHGGHYATEEIARSALPFINSSNVDQYKAALREMNPRSTTHLHLKLNLEEWARMQRGG
jgi:hypothetical protein